MDAVKWITTRTALVALLAAVAVACAGPPTVRTAAGQAETIAAAAQARLPGVSDATRVAAYCAIEETAIETLQPWRQEKNPPRFATTIAEAASLAATVAEVAPDEIAGALRTQRSELRRIEDAIERGTFDVLAYGHPGLRLTSRSQRFLDAVAAIATFDRDVCGID